MTRDDSISLHEPVPHSVGESNLNDTEQDVSDNEPADSRQWESKKTRISVLVGSAVLQLPIWGELTDPRC